MEANVTEQGVVMPKAMLEEVGEVDIGKAGGLIVIVPTLQFDPNKSSNSGNMTLQRSIAHKGVQHIQPARPFPIRSQCEASRLAAALFSDGPSRFGLAPLPTISPPLRNRKPHATCDTLAAPGNDSTTMGGAMMSAVSAEKTCSGEEYLDQERRSPLKSEFHAGRIVAMTGASREHNLVTVNIAAELRNQFKGRPCEVYVTDMRVKAGKANAYHYPDIAVVCGAPEFEDAFADTLLNPTVLIEVLSPSTEAYDRGGKFAHYRKIPSLCEYLLLAQDQARVESYARQGESWVLTETEGLSAVVHLASLSCSLVLSEIYDRVLENEAATRSG
jgi:Uma2 family endonuclease